jgi:hypothetical protein
MDLTTKTLEQLKDMTAHAIKRNDKGLIAEIAREAQRRVYAAGIVFKSTPEGRARARAYLKSHR